jgi:hypothetical protein
MHFNSIFAVLGLGLCLNTCMAWEKDVFGGPKYYVESVYKGSSTNIPKAIDAWYQNILATWYEPLITISNISRNICRADICMRSVNIPDTVGVSYVRCGPEDYTKAVSAGIKIKRVFITGIDPKHFRAEAGWKAVFSGWLRGVIVS